MRKNEKEFVYQDTAGNKYKKMKDRKERRNERIRKIEKSETEQGRSR